MLQLVEPAAGTLHCLTPADEGLLGQRVRGTVFEPGRVANIQGLLTAQDVATHMQQQLPDSLVPDALWQHTLEQLAPIPLWRLQLHWATQVLQGRETLELPPGWAGQRERARACAAMGFQRAPGDSSRGLDRLLPPGLGPDVHYLQAQQLRSPFDVTPAADTDMKFAAKAIAVWGPYIRRWRDQQDKIMNQVEAALEELTEHIQ